jgi:hypothetical protein
MRLLNVDTLKLETFYEPHVPRYAALSHTWGKEEVLFQDIEAGQRDRKNWTKIYRSASTAQVLGWKYIWIDTCCIDKTSSAELSEAINSMYRWYLKCDVCIAYLEDVSLESDLNEVDHNAHIATHLLLYPTFSQGSNEVGHSRNSLRHTTYVSTIQIGPRSERSKSFWKIFSR